MEYAERNKFHNFRRTALDFSERLRGLVFVGPKAYVYVATVVFAGLMTAVLVNRHLGLHLFFPVELTPLRLAAAYFFCIALVCGGIVFLKRIGPVLARAQAHQLYANAADNKAASVIAVRILGRFHFHAGADYGLAGYSAGLAVSVLLGLFALAGC